MDILRILKHLMTPPWAARRVLTRPALAELESAVKASEATHRGEVRFAVEGALDLGPLWCGQSSRDRAWELFSALRVWDTEENNGVLIYLLLADRRVEIAADRGIHGRAGAESWAAICTRMEQHFRRGAFKNGLLLGLQEVSALLAREYPARAFNPNELPDRPEIIR